MQKKEMILKSTTRYSTALLFSLLSFSYYVQAKPVCTSANSEQNITACTKLADSGDAKAQNTLGEIYYLDALIHKGYHTKARILFEKAAAQGLAQAQYNLGAMYRDEFNNFPVALTWFEKAAAQGNSDAQNSIGYIYENGSGGEMPRLYTFDDNGKNTDPNIAKYKQEFANYETGYFSIPPSLYPRSLYPIAEFGQGVEQNYTLAATWYQKAAKQGHTLAQTNLAYLYLMGLGVDKDEQRAFELYQQAAKQDFVPALNSLAFMYIQGLGTDENVAKGFATLVKSYQLQPNYNIRKTITRLRYAEIYQYLQLKANLLEVPNIESRIPFEASSSNDEDYLFERLHSVTLSYNLNILNSDSADFALFFSPDRPTAAAVLDIRTGERYELKKLYYIKRALQSNLDCIEKVSYYYKGEEQDMVNAQLWRKYAIKMGAPDTPENWPGYDD